MDKTTQKCWYCKRNPADKEFLNVKDDTATNTELKGFKKVTHTTTRTFKVVRCKECYEVHQKGSKLIGVAFPISYVLSYILFCILIDGGDWIKYVIFIFISILPSLLVTVTTKFITGSYYAIKYNTKTEWARGGSIL